MEINTPFVAEDFSPGDRVYFAYSQGFNKGNVDSVDDTVVHVVMDDGQSGEILLSSFVRSNTPDEHWGKIPNLHILEEGSVLSRLTDGGTRTFTTVLAVIPGKEIIIESKNSPFGTRSFMTKNGDDLEVIFRDCEIEG